MLKVNTDEPGRELIRQGVKGHYHVDALIADLRSTQPEHEDYDVKFKTLAESVEYHIERDENGIFPDAEQRLGNGVLKLGERLERLRETLVARLHESLPAGV